LSSGRGLWDGLITRPEESYRLWRVVVCDQETSNTRRLKPANGLWKIQPQWVVTPGKQTKPGLCVYSIQKLLKKTFPNNDFKQFRFVRLEILHWTTKTQTSSFKQQLPDQAFHKYWRYL